MSFYYLDIEVGQREWDLACKKVLRLNQECKLSVLDSTGSLVFMMH